MEIVGQRLRTLRENLHISQKKIAELIKTTQSSVNRYENGQSAPPLKVLVWYADYFDVSLDYIFGRTDKPQGKLYQYEPDVLKKKVADREEWSQFVEMCFDPKSPMSAKLKETLMKMMEGGKE